MTADTETLIARLLSWCGNRVEFPSYTDPSELKADIRAVLERLAAKREELEKRWLGMRDCYDREVLRAGRAEAEVARLRAALEAMVSSAFTADETRLSLTIMGNSDFATKQSEASRALHDRCDRIDAAFAQARAALATSGGEAQTERVYYDHQQDRWIGGRCPHGDVCTGCDARGYCTREHEAQTGAGE